MENKKKLRPAQIEKAIKGALTAALAIVNNCCEKKKVIKIRKVIIIPF